METTAATTSNILTELSGRIMSHYILHSLIRLPSCREILCIVVRECHFATPYRFQETFDCP